MNKMPALSIRQPFVEQIFRGTKKIEYRNIPTKRRGRIYVYAAKKAELEDYSLVRAQPGDLPLGVIVGTVEVWGCRFRNGGWQWLLCAPRRLKRPIKPKGRPNVIWFYPF